MVLCFIFRGAHIYLYMSHFMSKLSNYNCLFIIPDILVLITGHFGLFKTPTLRLGEAGRTQTQSQTRQLNISKIDFKSVRKTISTIIWLVIIWLAVIDWHAVWEKVSGEMIIINWLVAWEKVSGKSRIFICWGRYF